MSSRDTFMDYQTVEERLQAAFRTLWLLPDRERGWLHVGSMPLWRDVVPDRVDIDMEPTPGRPGVSRWEHDRMEEALGWCQWVSGDARKVIGAVMEYTRAGEREVRWVEVRRRLGTKRTTDALRVAYGRALTRICGQLNGCDGSAFGQSREKIAGH